MFCQLRRLSRFSAAALLLALLPAGCGTPPGVIFPPLANAPAWPPPPDPSRILYVGQLEKDQDLKPGVSGFEAFGEVLFGKHDAHFMLSPMSVCTDGGNRIFVADSNAQLVHVFDLDTRQYATWTPGKGKSAPPPFALPVAVAWDPVGRRLLVSDSAAGAVVMFDAAGKYLGHLGAASIMQRPVGLAVEGGTLHPGRILVADAGLHQVLVYAGDGTLVQRLGQRGTGPGQFNFPTYIALDPAGFIYISDSLNFRVQQFDDDLKFVRQIGRKGDMPGYFAEPKGVAVDSEGHLYVVDAQFENVQVYDNQGQVLMDFGEEGSGPGQFWLPTSICIDSHDRVYVTDSYNRRIQVFDYRKPQSETKP